MNQYPLWLYILIVVVLGVGVVYSLPNLYGSDPSLQISARRSQPVDEALQAQVTAVLDQGKVAVKGVERAENRLLLRFADVDTRARARELVETAIGEKYIIALNSAASTPHWLDVIGAKPMYMGLDLRGGVHFLMQVDMDAVRVQTDERFVSELRTAFREAKVRYRSIARDPAGGIRVTYLNDEMKQRAQSVLSQEFADLIAQEVTEPASDYLQASVKLTEDVRRTALKQNLTTLRNRVNEFGVSEPVIQQQGDSRIVAQPPGRDGHRGSAVRLQLVPLREGQPVHRDLGEIVEDRDPVVRRVVVGRPVGHLHEQASRPVDHEREEVMRRDEVGLDREPEDPQPRVEIELPDGRVPLRGAALEQLGAPDVIDEHVDVAVIPPDPLGQPRDLIGLEMIGGRGDADAAQPRDELGRLLDGLRAVVFRPRRARGAAGADDGRARLAERRRDAAPGAARRSGDHGHATPQRFAIRFPCHERSVPGRRALAKSRSTPAGARESRSHHPRRASSTTLSRWRRRSARVQQPP